jgi:hypothetical protein
LKNIYSAKLKYSMKFIYFIIVILLSIIIIGFAYSANAISIVWIFEKVKNVLLSIYNYIGWWFYLFSIPLFAIAIIVVGLPCSIISYLSGLMLVQISNLVENKKPITISIGIVTFLNVFISLYGLWEFYNNEFNKVQEYHILLTITLLLCLLYLTFQLITTLAIIKLTEE